MFAPSVFVNIHDTLSVKAYAMSAYTSEVRPYPHPRAPEALVERARVWGVQVGMEAVEPFMLLREMIF